MQATRAPRLYVITDGRALDRGLVQTARLYQEVLRAVRDAFSGPLWLQVREPALSSRLLWELSAALVEVATGQRTPVLINDRADLAIAAGAAGVHLKESGLAAEEARRLLGPRGLLAVSRHSPAGVAQAHAAGADAVLFGPIFETPAKRQYGAPQGLGELAAAAAAAAGRPLLAVGGIETTRDAQAVLEAGATGVAAIRAFADPDRARALAEAVASAAAQPVLS